MSVNALHVPARSGQAYWLYGSLFTSLITGAQSNGSISLMEILLLPHASAHLHLHVESDEQFYVLEGDLEFRLGDAVVRVTAGDVVFIPRGTLHGFTNGSTIAKVLASFTPAAAGIEFEHTGAPADAAPRWLPPDASPR